MDIKNLLKPRTKLIEELEAARREMAVLSKENERLSLENGELSQENNELKQETRNLKKRIEALEGRINTLTTNIRVYMRRIIEKSKRIIDLNERIKEVIHDSLSGLYSRRVLEEMEILPPGTSYIIFDIDNFKGVNDSYSHDIGDLVIKIIGKCVKKIIKRQSDFSINYTEDSSVRYGGDEFAIILPLCDFENAKLKCETLRKEIEEECREACIPRKITITVGIYYNESDPSITPQEGVHRADVALKKGKETGKDKIINYDDVIAEPEKDKEKV